MNDKNYNPWPTEIIAIADPYFSEEETPIPQKHIESFLLIFLIFNKEMPTIDNFAEYISTQYYARLTDIHKSINVALKNKLIKLGSGGELYSDNFKYQKEIKDVVAFIKKTNKNFSSEEKRQYKKMLIEILSSGDI